MTARTVGLIIAIAALVAAAALWAPGGRATAEPGELRIELIGRIDMGGALPPGAWLASFVLVNETEHTWLFDAHGAEPAVERWVEGLQGWEPLPLRVHGGAESVTGRGRIRPGEKIPFLRYGDERLGVQRFQLALDHRTAGRRVTALSPPVEFGDGAGDGAGG